SQSLLYHIFNRGNGRSEIFHAPDDYRQFIKILCDYREKNNLRVYHWVLMPNHYHLLLELDQPPKLSAIMAGIGRSYVHYHHRVHKSAGHLWQGRFKCQPVEKERYLFGCGRYIERNPVKTGMCARAEEYPCSSAAFYVFGKSDGLTTENPLFASFAPEEAARRQKYREYLTDFNAEEEFSFDRLESPVGGMEFLRRLVKEKGLLVRKRKGKARSAARKK
ncbi:MAG: transposase, partial [Candidatus Omnitrophota bacterium]